MLTAKNARHDHIVARLPATSGPIALPTPPSAPQSPIASARRSDGKITSITASDVVKQHAAATPCSARPTMNDAEAAASAQIGRRGTAKQHHADEQEPAGAEAIRHPTDEQERGGEPERGDRHDGTERSRRGTEVVTPICGRRTATPFRSTDSAINGRLDRAQREPRSGRRQVEALGGDHGKLDGGDTS